MHNRLAAIRCSFSHTRHASDGAHRLYTSLGFDPEAEGFRLYLKDVPASVRAAEAK